MVFGGRGLLVLLIIPLLSGTGCGTLERIGVSVFYEEAELPESQVLEDQPFVAGGGPKQRLDLFLPSGEGWPTMIFIHGGGWTEGDKNLRVGGADVYGNIGRFYAARGIGVAVINYRLIPEVAWREQLLDAARAAAWVHDHIENHGGDPEAIFLSGHSAGAQLAARLALDSQLLRQAGFPPGNILGVIAVSGAGLDLEDEATYELGQDREYYARRFADSPDWTTRASPVSYVRGDAPPFLILYAGGEEASLRRQSERLHEALIQNGVSSRIVVEPGQSHGRIVLTLSRDDRTAGPAIIEFVHERIRRAVRTSRVNGVEREPLRWRLDSHQAWDSLTIVDRNFLSCGLSFFNRSGFDSPKLASL